MPIPSHLPTSPRGIRRPRVSPPGTIDLSGPLSGPLSATLSATESGTAGDDGMTRDLAARLQHARESERAALARELHDELGAILTAARLDVAWLSAQGPCQDPEIARRLQALRQLLGDGIGLKRRLVEDLHPTLLTHLGFGAALEQLLVSNRERFAGKLSGELDKSVKLTGDAALALYRVAQESLTNIHKYAGASEVRVRLLRSRGRIELSIEDDGCGFDPKAVGFGHQGLSGLRDRMLAVSGRLEVASAPGLGTVIRASLPTQERGRIDRSLREAGVTASISRSAPRHHAPTPLHP